MRMYIYNLFILKRLDSNSKIGVIYLRHIFRKYNNNAF
jgi:hypothetical protein